VLIRPIVFDGYLCSPQTAGTGKGLGVVDMTGDDVVEMAEDEAIDAVEDEIAETVEEEATTSDGEEVAVAVDDTLARSRVLEDMEEMSELANDDTARQELGDATRSGGKQVLSYNCAPRLSTRLSTCDSGIPNE
jgi:hypothetical protein